MTFALGPWPRLKHNKGNLDFGKVSWNPIILPHFNVGKYYKMCPNIPTCIPTLGVKVLHYFKTLKPCLRDQISSIWPHLDCWKGFEKYISKWAPIPNVEIWNTRYDQLNDWELKGIKLTSKNSFPKVIKTSKKGLNYDYVIQCWKHLFKHYNFVLDSFWIKVNMWELWAHKLITRL
jgi:hypothetical protein